MKLKEAIQVRKSIRGYKPDPVPVETIKELLELAARAPSSVNSQPWEFFVVTGEALDALRKAYMEQVRSGTPPQPEVPISKQKGYATGLEGVYRDRQIRLAKQLFKILGITKEDRQKMQDLNEKMYRFYDAPAAIVLVMDRVLLSDWPLVDVGIMAGTIAYAAQEYGLGTCIMRAIVDYPDQLRTVVGIPESKQIILGIVLGYPDAEDPINQLVSERENLENLLTVVDRPKA